MECKNSTGLDEHEIRVDILAPPAKPTGPVEVSKVTPHRLHPQLDQAKG